MRILVTGDDGYIGTVLSRFIRHAGHDVVGLDAGLFQGCSLGPEPGTVPSSRMDVREVRADHLRGFDAVVHLAAISNDPLGNLEPERTYEINHVATVQLARMAKDAGVARFVFASSCSLYGAASPDDVLTESAEFNPVTPYGDSKALAERDLSLLADDRFSPVFLRNATVYGYSPRLRLDLVVNDLVANAFAAHEVVIKSDGTPWRPLVHVEDVSRAALAALEAPRDAVHNEAFNIGATEENYQVREIADVVADAVPGSRIIYADGGGADPRCYRVNFSKVENHLPGFSREWRLVDGIRELLEAFQTYGLNLTDLSSPRFIRLLKIQTLVDEGTLASDLRWLQVADRV
jgi:nucleoside-diphosphate-sugar epimerase